MLFIVFFVISKSVMPIFLISIVLMVLVPIFYIDAESAFQNGSEI